MYALNLSKLLIKDKFQRKAQGLIVFLFVLPLIVSPFYSHAQDSTNLNQVTREKANVNWIVKPFLEAYQITEYNPLKKRVVFATKKSRYDGKMGMANLQGEILLKPEYMMIEDRDSIIHLLRNYRDCFIRDLSSIECMDMPDDWGHKSYLKAYQLESEKSGLRFIKKGKSVYRIETLTGDFITMLEADEPPRFIGKFILYRQKGKMGLLDQQGKQRIPLKYAYISGFVNGHSALAHREHEDAGVLIDTLGNVIFEPKDSMILSVYGDDLPHFILRRRNQDSTGIVDEWGRVVTLPVTRFIRFGYKSYAYSNGLLEKWYINSIPDNQPMFEGRGFTDVNFFKDTIITREFKDTITLPDWERNIVQVFTAESKKISEVKVGRWAMHAYITKEGKYRFIVISNDQKFYYHLNGQPIFNKGSAEDLTDLGFIIKENEKYGMVSFTGEVLIPFVLDGLTYLDEEDSKSLWGKLDGKWGMLQIK